MSIEVPSEKWQLVNISEVGDIITGKTPSTKDPELWGNDIPFITPTDISDDKYIRYVDRYVSYKGAEKLKVLPAGSVLVSMPKV